MPGRHSRRRVVIALSTALTMGAAWCTATPASAAAPTSLHVNFQPAATAAPTGYTADTGKAWNGTSGWQTEAGAALDMSANTRVRSSPLSPSVRYDTQLLMQAPASSTGSQLTQGRWVAALANGSYAVTVAVGDPTAINSVDEITAQPGTSSAAVVVGPYTPTNAAPWSTQTAQVMVTNGLLVLDATGGSNTKIDFVDAVPSGVDTTDPTMALQLGGTLQTGSTYVGPVTVTASSSDNIGVTGTTYSVDGAAAIPYAAPVVVSAVGSHTVTVTARDAAGNTGAKTAAFTVVAPTPPAAPTSLHVNFAAQTSASIPGYVTDYGLPYSTATGYGWESTVDGSPLSLVGNGRERGAAASPDKRYDTLLQMQETAASTGVKTPGQWEYALANGTYSVTVAVGDDTAINSVYRITAEPGGPDAVLLVNNVVPTTSAYFTTATAAVTVADGRLTLSAQGGGANTKIDFVTAVPAGPATTPTPTPTTPTPTPTTPTPMPTTPTPTPTTPTPTPTTPTPTTTTPPPPSTAAPVPSATSASPAPTPSTPSPTSAAPTPTTPTPTTPASTTPAPTTPAPTTSAPVPPTGPTSAHVNFAAQTSAGYPGYVTDYGLPYTSAAGFGWESAVDQSPLSLVGNGRERGLPVSPDKRYDTQMQMQETAASSGVKTPGQWEVALASGIYSVTVAVGDASAVNSVDRITAEAGNANFQVLVNNFVPSTSNYFDTTTTIVAVTDGRLTLSAENGGSNTKLDFVDVVPAPPGATPAPGPPATPPVTTGRVIGRLSPATGSYFGATSENKAVSLTDAQWETYVQGREGGAGRSWDIVNSFPGWTAPLNSTRVQWEVSQGIIPMISWNTPTSYTDDQITAGAQDSVITAQAQSLKSLGAPVFLRFDWEMNGNWFAWDGTHNNDPGTTDGPAKFVAMWQHVHDIFTAVGATNVVWVWCASPFDLPVIAWNHWDQYYPGDAYVDWVAADQYNWAGQPTPNYQGWTEFAGEFAPFYNDFAGRKPIMLAETASAELAGHDKGQWITNERTAIETQYPDVEAVNWFDINYQNDWRYDTSASSLGAYRAYGADPYFNPLSLPDAYAVKPAATGLDHPV